MPRRDSKGPTARQEPARAHIKTFLDRDEYLKRVLASDLSSPAKVIVACLTLHLNIESGRLQVSADTLAGESRFSVRHVLRLLQEAEAAGWLDIWTTQATAMPSK